MAKIPITWNGINPLTGQPFKWSDDFTWDGFIETPDPIPMSEDNYLTEHMTPDNITAFLAKIAEAAALLSPLPELTDKALKRVLGIDDTTEVDDIAAEAMVAHPEWKPFVVDLTEYPKDAASFTNTAPMDTATAALARKVVLMRRFAANDTRRATLAIYNQLAELAARGNVDAKGYYDRMSPHFPGRPPKPPIQAA